jgi:DNA-binding IclR family transcriptional regulator
VSEADYLVLLKGAKRQTRVSARLIAAVEQERKRGTYLFTGLLTDGLAPKAVAIVHAPKAVRAVDRELERARKK